MIQDLIEFGKWLDKNNQDDFGKNVRDDDYILDIRFDKISKKYGLPLEEIQKEFEVRTRLLYTLFQKKVLSYDKLQRVINNYQKNPKDVLQKFGLGNA